MNPMIILIVCALILVVLTIGVDFSLRQRIKKANNKSQEKQ